MVVVGGVDDRDDLRRRDRTDETGEETGGTDTAGEGREHGRRLILQTCGRSEARLAAQPPGWRVAREPWTTDRRFPRGEPPIRKGREEGVLRRRW